MMLVGKRKDSLGQHFPFLCIDTQFPLVGATNSSSNTNDITSISPIFDTFECISKSFLVKLKLNGSSFVLEGKEGQFTKHSTHHDSTSDSDI